MIKLTWEKSKEGGRVGEKGRIRMEEGKIKYGLMKKKQTKE